MEDSFYVARDGAGGAGGAGEADGVPVVKEKADGEEVTGVELREDMGLTGGCRNAWEVELTRVGASDGAAIKQGYSERRDSGASVAMEGIYIYVIDRDASVGNSGNGYGEAR